MEFDNKSPIYFQMMENVRKRIIAGELAPGEKIAAVRELALELGVNPNTAQKALARLEEEGYLVTNRTNGRFVTEDIEFIRGKKEEMAMAAVKRFLHEMASMGYDRAAVLALINSLSEVTSFPALEQEGGSHVNLH